MIREAKRVTLRAAWLAVIFLPCSIAAFAANEKDPRIWLEPCAAMLAQTPDNLERGRRLLSALEFDKWPFVRAGDPVARLIVEPAFAPDWAVTVFHPEDQSCTIVSTVLDHNVYYANETEKHGQIMLRKRPANISSTTKQVGIPCELADLVGHVWSGMLRRPRLPEAGDPTYFDGTQYTATRFELNVGDLCGSTHVPPTGSPADKMVRIGDAMRELANADTEQQKQLIEKIHKMAKELAGILENSGELSN